MMAQTVYKGRNSPFRKAIKDVAGTTYTTALMGAITRVRLKVGSLYADSDAHSGAFDWATYATRGELIIDIGLIDFAAQTDNYCELIVYDATYTSGRVVEAIVITIDTDTYASGTLAAAVDSGYNFMAAALVTADGEYSGPNETLTVGENVSAGDVCCWDISTSKCMKAKADLIATMPGLYMATADALADATCIMLKEGYYWLDAWSWTVDDSVKLLYASGATAGGMSESAVSTSNYFSQAVATIYSAKVVYFKPSLPMAEVA